MSKTYRVGIYCRLSKDDESNSAKAKNYFPVDESVSIENQREMLSKFVMLNGWIEIRTYIDDGYSGANFQRPGFLEMLEDARKGVINLILVKDLSRLGRDYVEVGRYTTEVFPLLGVRFVSLLDCLDTNGDTDMLHFRSLMNDYHLRDLSRKVRSVLYSKKVSGQYTSSMAPYGYCKSTEDKHKLVIDEYAAGVVRRIYEMRKDGMSYTKIAAVLNQECVPSPMYYWSQNHHGANDCLTSTWKAESIKVILWNEVYHGTLVMNYTGSRSYKDRTTIRKPRNEWIQVERNHEPIISEELWQEVQSINERNRARYSGGTTPTKNLLAAKLICADCGHLLVASTSARRVKSGEVKRYVSYRCNYYLRTGCTFCSIHSISEMTLVQIILEEIRTQAKAVTMDEAAVVEKLKRRILSQTAERTAATRKEIAMLQRRVAELEDMTAKLYEDKISGAVSAETFALLMGRHEEERIEKVVRLESLTMEIAKVDEETAAICDWARHIRQYMDVQALDRAIIDELIDHIEVGEKVVVDGHKRQSVKIFYRFIGSLD